MKNILIIAFTSIIYISNCQNSIKCIRSDKYKIMSNGKMIDYKGTAVACFNGNYFSYKLENQDIITFEIETQSRTTYTLTGKLVDQFINKESKTNSRGFYSVDISYGTEIEVTINFPNGAEGYAIYFANKSWLGGQDATVFLKNNSTVIPETNKEKRLEVKQDNLIIEEPKREVYTVVEEMPEFPGGPMEMMKYIQKNIQYPQMAKESGISGKCFVKFIINPEGDIEEAKVLKGVPGCKECDAEAIRVIKSMPKWIPGKQNGKAVYVYYNYPVNFQLK